MIYILFILNIFICINGFLFSFKKKSLFTIWWVYIFYFAILYFINSFHVSAHEIDWYSNIRPIISTLESKEEYYLFISLTNFLIFLGLRISSFKEFKFLKIHIVSRQFIILNKVFILIFFISFIFLLYKVSGYSYNDLTSSADFGGWSWIFVQVSMSSIIYVYFKKNYKLLILIIVFSLFYTLITFVRSIFLYSIFTLVYLFLIEIYFSNRSYSYFLKKIAIPALILGVLSTSALLLRGASELKLPESPMVEQSYTLYNALHIEQPLLWNDYLSFFKGIFIPFDRFINIDFSGLLTSPIQNARILFTGDISDVDFEYFYHYPNLFYNQLFSSFRWYGILGGFILIKYFIFLEKFIRKSYARLFFFMPIFSWHIFMIFRGALDISTMGIAYALWIQIIFYHIFRLKKFI